MGAGPEIEGRLSRAGPTLRFGKNDRVPGLAAAHSRSLSRRARPGIADNEKLVHAGMSEARRAFLRRAKYLFQPHGGGYRPDTESVSKRHGDSRRSDRRGRHSRQTGGGAGAAGFSPGLMSGSKFR